MFDLSCHSHFLHLFLALSAQPAPFVTSQVRGRREAAPALWLSHPCSLLFPCKKENSLSNHRVRELSCVATALFSTARTASWAAGSNSSSVIAELCLASPAPGSQCQRGCLGIFLFPPSLPQHSPGSTNSSLSHTMGGTVIVISGL